MSDYYEIDFLSVETAKSGDAITLRYAIDGIESVHVVDGGYIDTGDQVIEHLQKYHGHIRVDHVVLTHPDRDHANGLRKVLEHCQVGHLWMNRPWIYAKELLPRFETYTSEDALRRKLRSIYDAAATLEDIALQRGIPIHAPFQGEAIGAFKVLSPSRGRYLDLVVDSGRTPEAVEESADSGIVEKVGRLFKAATEYVKSLWGDEYFPSAPTSRENEMSVIQTAILEGDRILLTGDAGREGLQEAIDYAKRIGIVLPGIKVFQVPHHGGRHNVSTEILDQLLGDRLPSLPEKTMWNAICSAAKADEDHPRKSVIRAMIHRGGHFASTEKRGVRKAKGIDRENWYPIPQVAYPEEQED